MPTKKSIVARRTRPNYLYSIVSVALVLFLLGFFGLLLLHARQLVRHYQENVNLIVEFEETTSAAQIDSFGLWLGQQGFVRPGTVKHVDQQAAANMMREEFGEEFLQLDLPNPFFDIVTFNVQAAYMQPDSLKGIQSLIQEQAIVTEVFYQESILEQLAGNVQRLGYVALGLGIIFVVFTIILIHNTIRLALYSNRFLIKTMELVGASWMFISRPYLWRAFAHGLISACLAIGGLAGLLYWVKQALPNLPDQPDQTWIWALYGVLALAGIVIYLLSTFYAVNKYLNMRMDDLY